MRGKQAAPPALSETATVARKDLYQWLTDWSQGDATRAAVTRAIAAIAGVSIHIAERIWLGSLAGRDPAAIVGVNEDGDRQKALDVEAHEMFVNALRHAPVASLISEEEKDVLAMTPGAPLIVAMDPLDGSSNIDTNISVGTIFSILPAPAAGETPALPPSGAAQLAAGFIIYGPLTALVLTVGAGVAVFTLDRSAGRYLQTRESVTLPERKSEYAINASNYRHWDEPVRAYIDECLAGAEGPRAEDFNMRWVASLVAEAYRILMRGGIFLYPRDARKGYQHGRLRLVYEANPIAFLIEQAGGRATDGVNRILEIPPADIHQRTPLVFGSWRMVDRVGRYHRELERVSDRAPLFGSRGLFRK